MDAVVMFNNMYSALQDVWPVFKALCLLSGFMAAAQGLLLLSRNEPQKPTTGAGVTMLLAGGGLATIPEFISMGGETLVAQSLESNALAFSAKSSEPVLKAALSMGMSLIKLVGLIAIWKGFSRLKMHALGGQDPKLVSEAGTLFVMGTVAVFFPAVLKIIGNTVGGKVADFIGTYFV